MFGSQILEIAMGLIFVFLLFSIICSALNEALAGILDLRARTLKQGIEKLLEDQTVKGLADAIYAHPLVKGLAQGGRQPSYLPSHSFALALIDVALAKGQAVATPAADLATISHSDGKLGVAEVRSAVLRLPSESPVRRILLVLLDETVTDLSQARRNIARWFDEAMHAVGGWYKRRAHLIVTVAAAAITLTLNVDTIRITKTLWTDGNLRASLAAQAEAFRQANQNQPGQGAGVAASLKALDQAANQLQQAGLPIGWHPDPSRPSLAGLWEARQRVVTKLAGWALTIIAVSLGAPFWFEMLNKVANLRAAGKPPAPAQ